MPDVLLRRSVISGQLARFSFSCCLICVFPAAAMAASIGTMHFVKVEVVTQDKIPAHDKYWDDGVIREPLFRITFSSDVDLERLAKVQNYNIDNTTAICSESSPDPNRRLRGFPSVLDSKGRVDEFRAGTGDIGIAPPFQYHIYFDVRQNGAHGFYPYDLARDPRDVCITVNGAQESLFWITNRLRSEPLVVPAQKIAGALVKAGLQ